ncbi:sensor histidine kinase [Amycolatopsis minnesotensis]|uniref:sensor histidine kinase n=1 Tax=Amycolatopsis minnesotensis TaxID=337894 RepID=UPI0031D211CE
MTEFLPRHPAWFPLWPERRDAGYIVGAAALFTVLDATLFAAGPDTTGWLGPFAWLVTALAADFALVFLVRYPVAVAVLMIAISAAWLASDLFSPGLLKPVMPLTLTTVPVAVPAIATQLPRLLDRRTGLILVGVLALFASRPWAPSWSTTPFGLLTTVAPALGGMYVEARRQLVSSLRDRAERAEREQELLAERARAQERRHLAAEMHDVVTHRLSLMVLQAGALGVVSTDDKVRTAANDIRQAGTQALDELRDLVGVLRGDEAIAMVQPGRNGSPPENPADFDALVADSGTAGTPVSYQVEGERESVSPTVARTAYRVVQEALTNIRKHAPGSATRVQLRYLPDGLRISVVNEAPSRPPDPLLAASGSGAGLLGLRQRVELIGGSLHSGHSPDGGYRVDAILPAYVPTAESTRHDQGDRRR